MVTLRITRGRDRLEAVSSISAVHPRAGPEAVEDVPGLGQQRDGLVGSALRLQPLAVLQEGHREPKRRAELAERSRCPFEPRFHLVRLFTRGVDPGPEPGYLGLE